MEANGVDYLENEYGLTEEDIELLEELKTDRRETKNAKHTDRHKLCVNNITDNILDSLWIIRTNRNVSNDCSIFLSDS